MLTQLTSDRAYEARGTLYDNCAPSVLPRRRFSQRELMLFDELYNGAVGEHHTKVAYDADDNIRAMWTEPTDSKEYKAAREALNESPLGPATNVMFDALHDGMHFGYLSGLREGFRIGAGLMSRLAGSAGGAPTFPAESPIGTPAEFLALMVGAMADDATADRLIGILVTGKEPEMVPAASVEGGAR